jgi:hypothetical protein
LPYFYWIPKLYKTPYKERYIAGSKKSSTKPLSILLTEILTAVKERFQMYCATVYAFCGVNQMWILKKIKKELESLNSPFCLKFTALKPMILQHCMIQPYLMID